VELKLSKDASALIMMGYRLDHCVIIQVCQTRQEDNERAGMMIEDT